jgi:ABC-type thiamine transport system substrate-binding protein
MSQGKKSSEKHLYEVANVFMRSYASSTNTQKAVAAHFGIPVSSAAKQIIVARKRGILPATEELRLRRQYDKAKHNLEKYVNDLELLHPKE